MLSKLREPCLRAVAYCFGLENGGVRERLKSAVLKTFALLLNCLLSIGSPQR